VIGYYLYLNGQFDGATVDPYPNQVNMYLTLGVVNNRGICRRRAGNRCAPAILTVDLRLLE